MDRHVRPDRYRDGHSAVEKSLEGITHAEWDGRAGGRLVGALGGPPTR